MRFTQLRSFLAVAHAGGFTAAAERMGVSQPTLTAQVKLLEERYGVELFHRVGRGVRLTETGRQLLALTGQLSSIESDAMHLLKDAGDLKTGLLSLGAVGPFQAMDMMSAFMRRYPAMEVRMRFGNSETVLQELLEFRTDVAVLAHFADDPRLYGLPYSRSPVVVFVPVDHRLAGRESIGIEELDGERMIVREEGSTTRKAVETRLAEAGVSPRIVMELASREAIREAVARGIGIATVSESGYVPDARLRRLRLSNAQIWTETHVMCLKNRRTARAVDAFFGVAEELRRAAFAPAPSPRAA